MANNHKQIQIERTQLKIGKFFSRKFSLLTGNATTALYLIIKSLNLPKGSQIMISNSLCPHVPASIYLAEHKPVFVDIDKKTFGLNLKNIKKNITNKIKAVIAAHAYGIPCEIKKIAQYCKKKNIPLIEDAALTLGLKIKNKYSGSFGDASVFSFGKGKVINVGGGGIILTNNQNLFNKTFKNYNKLREKTKIHDNSVKFINSNHTKLYNTHFLNNQKNKLKKLFKIKYLNKAKFLLYKFEVKNIKKLFFNKEKFKSIAQKRNQNMKFLKKKLNKTSKNFFKIGSFNNKGIPWRFNIFFLSERNRNFVLKTLLKKKLKVSSWHPSLDIFFQNRKKNSNFTVSDNLSSKILNIWINEEINKKYLIKICEEIANCKQFLSSKNLLKY